jgi:hypothetical protein
MGRRRANASCTVSGGPAPGPRTPLSSTITVSPYTVVLAAVVGAWLSHGLEYIRVWGWDGFGSSTSRQVHTYMGPVGLALLLLAFVGVEAGLRTFRRVERLLGGLADGTVNPDDASVATHRRFTLPVTSLLSLVWVLQLALYVVQENAELRAMGVHQPTLNVISGVHQWAAGIHLLVAAVLLGAIWLLHRPLARLVEAVHAVVAWLVAGRRRALPSPPVPPVRAWTPAERFGPQLWSRPPPGQLAV